MKKITRRTVLRASGLAAASLALSGCASTGSACVDNGFSDWVMGIQGLSIENGLEDNGGVLNFRYSMDINAMLASEQEVNIVVKECESNA